MSTASKPVRINTRELTLPVKLSDAEILDHSRAMTRARRDFAVLEEQRKAANDDFESRMTAMETVVERHARCVETGTEPRQVECADELVGNNVQTVRLDTGEVINNRPATAADRQVDLLGGADPDPDPEPSGAKRSRRQKAN